MAQLRLQEECRWFKDLSQLWNDRDKNWRSYPHFKNVESWINSAHCPSWIRQHLKSLKISKTPLLLPDLNSKPAKVCSSGWSERVDSLAAALGTCSTSKDLAKGKRIHSQALLLLSGECSSLATSLIQMYVKCGSLADARKVFDGLIRPEAACWSFLIQGYACSGENEQVLELFYAMQKAGYLVPDSETYAAAIRACAALAESGDGKTEEWLEKGREIHSRAEINPDFDMLFMKLGVSLEVFNLNGITKKIGEALSFQDPRRKVCREVDDEVRAVTFLKSDQGNVASGGGGGGGGDMQGMPPPRGPHGGGGQGGENMPPRYNRPPAPPYDRPYNAPPGRPPYPGPYNAPPGPSAYPGPPPPPYAGPPGPSPRANYGPGYAPPAGSRPAYNVPPGPMYNMPPGPPRGGDGGYNAGYGPSYNAPPRGNMPPPPYNVPPAGGNMAPPYNMPPSPAGPYNAPPPGENMNSPRGAPPFTGGGNAPPHHASGVPPYNVPRGGTMPPWRGYMPPPPVQENRMPQGNVSGDFRTGGGVRTMPRPPRGPPPASWPISSPPPSFVPPATSPGTNVGYPPASPMPRPPTSPGSGAFPDAYRPVTLLSETLPTPGASQGSLTVGGTVKEKPPSSPLAAAVADSVATPAVEHVGPLTGGELRKLGSAEYGLNDPICSELQAIAYAMIHTEPGATIRIVKDSRVCDDCHELVCMFSKVEKRKIICRDNNKLHVYENGECSCGDYW